MMRSIVIALSLCGPMMLAACSSDSDSIGQDISEASDLPEPPREILKASLLLRSALSLGQLGEDYDVYLAEFGALELAWLDRRQLELFDQVHSMNGSDRSEAAAAGELAPILLGDLYLWRSMILREPEVELGLRPGGVPDTVARLVEHSRIKTRTTLALLDTDIRSMEARLMDQEETADDGHLSIVETDMYSLRVRLVEAHVERLRLLPWVLQFTAEDDIVALLEDPAIRGWLLAHGEKEAL
jgi:hypothetical protein